MCPGCDRKTASSPHWPACPWMRLVEQLPSYACGGDEPRPCVEHLGCVVYNGEHLTLEEAAGLARALLVAIDKQ